MYKHITRRTLYFLTVDTRWPLLQNFCEHSSFITAILYVSLYSEQRGVARDLYYLDFDRSLGPRSQKITEVLFFINNNVI